MKTWIKRSLIAVLGASLLLGGALAFAHRHAHHHGWMGRMGDADIAQLRDKVVARLTKELALDDAQRAKLLLLADALQAQRSAWRGPGAAASADPRQAMQGLVAGAQFDRAGALALVEAKTGAVRDKAPAVVNAAADFFDSLKPEQQSQLRAFMARGGHRGGPRG